MAGPMSFLSTFERLPGLFDRSFLVGFWLPAILATALGALALEGYGRLTPVVSWQGEHLLLTLVLSWFGALLLLIFNGTILRMMEGYPPWNFLFPGGRRMYRRRLAHLKEQLKQDLAPAEMSDLKHELAVYYPPKEVYILPTAFGNVLRAFETYPPLMYGFEATRGWPRLLAVAPDAYKAMVDEAQTSVNFLLNLRFLFLPFLVACLGVAIITGRWPGFVPLASAALLLSFGVVGAKNAAVRWGEVVKSGFDLYLPTLRRQLELPRPGSRSEERDMWRSFSCAMLLRERDQLPERTPAEPSPELPESWEVEEEIVPVAALIDGD